jgi:hypothetical protein
VKAVSAQNPLMIGGSNFIELNRKIGSVNKNRNPATAEAKATFILAEESSSMNHQPRKK